MTINTGNTGDTYDTGDTGDTYDFSSMPPKPPIVLTEQVACCENTSKDVLWHIAKNVPDLRKWVVANPIADAKMLEYISQQGGPGVKHSLDVLLEAYEYAKNGD